MQSRLRVNHINELADAIAHASAVRGPRPVHPPGEVTNRAPGTAPKLAAACDHCCDAALVVARNLRPRSTSPHASCASCWRYSQGNYSAVWHATREPVNLQKIISERVSLERS